MSFLAVGAVECHYSRLKPKALGVFKLRCQILAFCAKWALFSNPLTYGKLGSCKSEALKCGVAIFEAQSNLYNSLTTSSHLFDVLKQTTIPIAIDDISEKSQDTWEEVIIDVYNNTRGTRF